MSKVTVKQLSKAQREALVRMQGVGWTTTNHTALSTLAVLERLKLVVLTERFASGTGKFALTVAGKRLARVLVHAELTSQVS